MLNSLFPTAAYLAAAALIAAGITLLVQARGYRFTGGLCLCAAAVILCYRFLNILQLSHPGFSALLRWIFTLCLLGGFAAAFITGCIIAKASRGKPEMNHDYIIVLGAGVDGTVPSMCLLERLDATYAYMTSHPDAICIASGGQGKWELIPEGQCIFNELTARGIDPDRIWIEDRSSTTLENIRFSVDLIEQKTGTRPETLGLVSNEYHLYRAAMFARPLGVAAIGIPAKTQYIFLRTNYFLREIAAVWFYRILGG